MGKGDWDFESQVTGCWLSWGVGDNLGKVALLLYLKWVSAVSPIKRKHCNILIVYLSTHRGDIETCAEGDRTLVSQGPKVLISLLPWKVG